ARRSTLRPTLQPTLQPTLRHCRQIVSIAILLYVESVRNDNQLCSDVQDSSHSTDCLRHSISSQPVESDRRRYKIMMTRRKKGTKPAADQSEQQTSAVTEQEGSERPSAAQLRPDDAEPVDFPIVGIGASAGGLAAFESFLSGIPTDT